LSIACSDVFVADGERNRAAAERYAANVLPSFVRAQGVTTLRGVARALKAHSIDTARVVEWRPVQVRDILDRADAP
jgi:hypothetical protein